MWLSLQVPSFQALGNLTPGNKYSTLPCSHGLVTSQSAALSGNNGIELQHDSLLVLQVLTFKLKLHSSDSDSDSDSDTVTATL